MWLSRLLIHWFYAHCLRMELVYVEVSSTYVPRQIRGTPLLCSFKRIEEKISELPSEITNGIGYVFV